MEGDNPSLFSGALFVPDPVCCKKYKEAYKIIVEELTGNMLRNNTEFTQEV